MKGQQELRPFTSPQHQTNLSSAAMTLRDGVINFDDELVSLCLAYSPMPVMCVKVPEAFVGCDSICFNTKGSQNPDT